MSGHLAVARTLSIVALTVLFIATDLFTSQSQLTANINEARELVAIEALRSNPPPSESKQGALYESKFSYPELGEITVKEYAVDPNPNLPTRFRVAVLEGTGRRFSVSVAKEMLESKDSALDLLRQKLQRLRIPYTPNEGVAALYHRLEDGIFDQRIAVPGLGATVRAEFAIWVLTVALLALTVQIRAGVRRARATAPFEDAWLVVDAASLLERLLALLWAGALVLGPTLVAAGLISVVTGLTRIRGSTRSLTVDLITISGALALLLGAMRVSLTLASDLMGLTALRSHNRRLEQAEPEMD